jgi:signal transduction histidine kinase
MLKNLLKKKTIEYRIVMPDKSIRYIWAEAGETRFDDNGNPIFLNGIAQDITLRKLLEMQLVDAKEKVDLDSANFTAILGSTMDSIWAFDKNYKIVFVNDVFRKEFYKYFGVWLELGVSLVESLPESLHFIWKPRYDAVLSNKQLLFEDAVETGNGIVYIRISMNPIIKNGEVIGGSCFGSNITERKLADEELLESKEQLRNFASHLQTVREKERESTILEIHDSVAQYLVALKMDLGLLRNKITRSYESIQQVELIGELEQLIDKVDNAIQSARSIMYGLKPEQLELLGIIEAAQVYLSDFEKNHHIRSRFESTLENPNLQPSQALALFRILQESLHNILKHAKATMVTVQLTNTEGKLVMDVIDNGKGFDVNQKVLANSYGMISMKERVKLLNGNFEITSKVDEGTKVRVELPYWGRG